MAIGKKSIKKFLLLIVCCLLASGCKEKISTKTPENFNLELNKDSILVHEEIYVKDLIIQTNGIINNLDQKINTNKLGKVEYKIEYTYNKKKYTNTFELDIIDNIEPKIFGSNSKTVLKNHSTDLCYSFLIGDNYDKKPTCIIEGELNLNKVGSYKVRLVVTDSSENQVTKDITINVVDKNNSTNPTPSYTRIPFSDTLEMYKNDDTELGIDISAWQGTVDFQKVKEAGATFVILRIGVHAGKGYEIKEDTYFQENLKKAKAAGLKIGVYFYSTATSVEEAKEHAAWVIDKLAGEKLDFPIAFDWENWEYWNYYEISFFDINEIVDIFIDELKKHGYSGMLYGSASYLNNIFNNNNKHPLWLAHYTKETNFEQNYILWQFTNIGSIPGVTGDIDINVMYKK